MSIKTIKKIKTIFTIIITNQGYINIIITLIFKKTDDIIVKKFKSYQINFVIISEFTSQMQ